MGDQNFGGWTYDAEGKLTDVISPIPFHYILSNARTRLNRVCLNNSVPLWRDSTAGILSVSPLILLLGESESSTTGHIVDLDTFGHLRMLLDMQEWPADAVH